MVSTNTNKLRDGFTVAATHIILVGVVVMVESRPSMKNYVWNELSDFLTLNASSSANHYAIDHATICYFNAFNGPNCIVNLSFN